MNAGTNAQVTVLVNSSDGFEDCWGPFFRLFREHWPDCFFPILLNTETRDYTYPGLDVAASRVAWGDAHRPTWSECLIRAIDQVRTPLVLYLQEDYFFDRPVRHAAICDIVETMSAHPSIAHVGLTKHGSVGPFELSEFPGLEKIPRTAGYRISTQAGLWRAEVLRSYLDPCENGWMFEIYGTLRARRRDDLFLTIDVRDGGPAIDYTHTGIIKGQWHPAMPELFGRFGINLDFTARGFHRPPRRLLRKWGVIRKLMQDPVHAARQLIG